MAMQIGVPKEIKTAEFRVALTPSGAARLVQAGHQVTVETSAGESSGFSDSMYRISGANVRQTADEVWRSSELILKVKEPLREEYSYLRRAGSDLIIFTYLHLAGVSGLAESLCDFRCTAVAYETVQLADGSLPLLSPMSEIAGELAVYAGATYLQRPLGKKGILLSGAAGIPPARLTIIGAGAVGAASARLAMAMGAHVTLLNRSPEKLKRFSEFGYPGSVETAIATEAAIAQAVQSSDVVIGAVYVAGARAEYVVTEKMVRSMEPGSVIVDVSIDQGGCVETSHATTYIEPVYLVNDVIHYCVANMPGAVPRTSTQALTNETLPYVMAIAERGIVEAAGQDEALKRGVNVHAGYVTNRAAAAATGLEFRTFDNLTA